jgi:small subunit ribosomal protein S2
MAVVGGVLGRAGQRGQQRRLADAKKNKATWENPPDLVQHMTREKKAAIAERKNVMGQMQHNLEGFTEEEQKLLREQFYGENLEVTESEMVDMMGEAALGAAKEAAAESVAPLPEQPTVSEAPVEVETKPAESTSTPAEQPATPEAAPEAQAEATPTESISTSPQQPTSSEAATQSPEQPAAPEVVAEAQSEIQPAQSTHNSGSRLTTIEEQLSGLKDAAEAIEADIKSGKK